MHNVKIIGTCGRFGPRPTSKRSSYTWDWWIPWAGQLRNTNPWIGTSKVRNQKLWNNYYGKHRDVWPFWPCACDNNANTSCLHMGLMNPMGRATYRWFAKCRKSRRKFGQHSVLFFMWNEPKAAPKRGRPSGPDTYLKMATGIPQWRGRPIGPESTN